MNITSAIGLEFLTDVSMTKATNSANDQHGFMDKRICEVLTRAVGSESRKVGRSLKIRKNRIKSEKLDLISYPTFWQKCQNAIKCQNACTSGQGHASEYFITL